MTFLADHAPELALTGVLIVCALVFVWACQSCSGRGDDR